MVRTSYLQFEAQKEQVPCPRVRQPGLVADYNLGICLLNRVGRDDQQGAIWLSRAAENVPEALAAFRRPRRAACGRHAAGWRVRRPEESIPDDFIDMERPVEAGHHRCRFRGCR